jgi:hypothetical protein
MERLVGHGVAEAMARDRYTAPGDLPRRMRLLVAGTLATTLIALHVAPRALWNWNEGFPEVDPFLFRNGLALGVVASLALLLIPPGNVSRWVRLAILLPMCQVAAMLVGWHEWRTLELRSWLHDAGDLSIGPPLAGALIACAAGSLVIAPWRTRERLHAAVMLSLSGLLLVGLWLPIAADIWGNPDWWDEQRLPITCGPELLIPPAIAAAIFTAVALRRPDWIRRAHIWLVAGLSTLLLLDLSARSHPSDSAAVVYSHYAPVVAGLALAALLAIGALALQLVIRRARARSLLRTARDATIATDDGPALVASFEVTSWLRGLRPRLRSFTAITSSGDLPVPSSIHLGVPVPLETTTMRPGDEATVLVPGDQIKLGGFVDQTVGDDPFRRAELSAPGPRGAVVGQLALRDAALTDVALHIWRPCVAYLVIAATIALPALITAL